MTQEQKAAYVNAMAACATIEAIGMQAANDQRLSLGQSIAYDELAFQQLLDKHGIHHNAVLGLFHDGHDD